MKSQTFDAIAAALGRPHGRRHALRLLGGAALGGALGVAGLAAAEAAEVDAAKKDDNKKDDNKKDDKEKPKKCRAGFRRCGKRGARCCRIPTPAGTCQPGQALGSVVVPGVGTIVNTPVLAAGRVYRLRATGAAPTNATHGQDAEYDFVFADPGNPALVTDAVPGFDFGISIDGAAPNWGPYNVGHIYETQVAGAGRAATLRLIDSIYTDNSGSITVEVFCA